MKNFRKVQRSGFTLIDLMAAIFVPTVTIEAFRISRPHFGFWLGILIAAFVCLVCLIAVDVLYRVRRLHYRFVANELTRNYPSVYRVRSLPSDNRKIIRAQNAEIAIGDYGWTAEPIYPDGLIYLHGLNLRWQVAWYAGFEISQLELIGPKPHSQYFLPHSWQLAWTEIPACPFPVLNAPETSLGHPRIIIGGYVQGVKIPSINQKKTG